MGLLDDISDSLSSYLPEDSQKREAAKMGLLSMGAAMMGAPTQNFGKALGAGLQGGVSGYGNAYEMAQKTGLQQAQMKLLQNQDRRTQQQFTIGRNLASNTNPMAGLDAEPGAAYNNSATPTPAISTQSNPLVSGAPMTGWSPQPQQFAPQSASQAPQQPGGFLRGMNPDQAFGYQMMGVPGVMEAVKLAKEGYVREQGKSYIDAYDGSEKSYAKLDSGQVQNRDGSVSNAPGYPASAAANAGAITGAQEAAKAPYTYQTVNTPEGPRMFRNDQIKAMTGGEPPSAAPPASFAGPAGTMRPATGPAEFQARTADFRAGEPSRAAAQRAIFEEELATEKNPTSRAMLQREIARLPAGSPALAQSAAPASSGPGIALETPADAARKLQSVTQEMRPNLDYSGAQATNLAEKGKALSGQVAESQELLKRISQSRDALTRFSAGGGAETRSQLAQFAQSIPGVPQKLVDRIAGGDLSAATEFQKYSVQEAMQTMRQSLASDDGKGSQGNRMAMQLFAKNNPNLDTDPRAIERIFNFQTQLHNQLLAQQDHFVNFTGDPKNPKDLTAFDNSWAHKAIDTGIVKPEIVTGIAKGLPASPAKPKGAPLQGQTVSGYKFKGGDPSNQANWEKQ